MIELTGLSKFYGDNAAIQNIDLLIQEGEIFGIIGKSGAGKSTLLRSINLLEKPSQGEVIVDNQILTNLTNADLRQSRHKIGMIFQQFNLLNSQTVYNNIALPMRIQGVSEEDIQTKINELLALVNLTDKQNFKPLQLSGGQQQRVAIARALSCSPKILLCDEATSSLDPESTESILSLLKQINAQYGITIVLITHEMEVVKQICHRLAVMEGGQLIEINSLRGVFENPNSPARKMLYAQLSPTLPTCLTKNLSPKPNHRPLLQLQFQGNAATVPFISKTSRELDLDINILLANIDRVDGITCGVLILELNAHTELQERFVARCHTENLIVELLGYVTDSDL